jgi:carbonic anhydrase
MDKILAGVAHFQSRVYPQQEQLFHEIAHGQKPRALFITCSDSRVLPNLITQTKPGELFLCRDVGNIVPAYGGAYGGVSATIEYSVTVLEVRHIIICGHSDCGAMRALLNPTKIKDLPSVYNWLNYAEAARRTVMENFGYLDGEQMLWKMIEQNVIIQMQNLKTHPAVAARLAKGNLSIHGWTYDIETGAIHVYDEDRHVYVPASSVAREREDVLDLSEEALLAR